MSNEKEIRNYFKNIVKNCSKAIKKDIQIVDEFCGGTMETRMDLALFTKDIFVAVEIKSDKDNLTRLDNQIRDYSKYASIVLVILDISHKKSFSKYLDKKNTFSRTHSYVYFYDNGKFDREFYPDLFVMFAKIERAKNNLYKLLWRDEKKELLSFLKGRSKIDLDKGLLSIYTLYELREICLYILYTRAINNKDLRDSNCFKCGEIPEIKYKEYKQILFDGLLLGKDKKCVQGSLL